MAHTVRPVQPSRDKIQEVVDANYKAFTRKLPEPLKTHLGQFALMRDDPLLGRDMLRKCDFQMTKDHRFVLSL